MIHIENLISSIVQLPIRFVSYLGSVIATAVNSLRGVIRWIRPDQEPTQTTNKLFLERIAHL